MIVVAMRRDPTFVDIENLGPVGEGADLAKLTIYAGAEKPIVEDGQHRNLGAVAAWGTVRDLNEETATQEQLELRQRLADSSVTIEMLFNTTRHPVDDLRADGQDQAHPAGAGRRDGPEHDPEQAGR